MKITPPNSALEDVISTIIENTRMNREIEPIPEHQEEELPEIDEFGNKIPEPPEEPDPEDFDIPDIPEEPEPEEESIAIPQEEIME